MGEEKKNKSVLNWSETEFLLGSRIANLPGMSDLVTEQRSLMVEEHFRAIWDAWKNRRWEAVLNEILNFPKDREVKILTMPRYYGDATLANMARASIAMLFKKAGNVSAHLSVEQVQLISKALRRIDENRGLGDEPWRTLFFDMAAKNFPSDAEEMIKAVRQAGIDEKEYVNALCCVIAVILHREDESLANAILNNHLLSIISKFYGFRNLEQREAQGLLKAGDALLFRQYFDRARGVYREIRKQNIVEIGDAREKIIAIQDKYDVGSISRRKRDKQICKIAKFLT